MQGRIHGFAFHLYRLHDEQIDEKSQSKGKADHSRPFQQGFQQFFQTGHKIHLDFF
jgi:hypothetical protein